MNLILNDQPLEYEAFTGLIKASWVFLSFKLMQLSNNDKIA